jgi:hypothetical protein
MRRAIALVLVLALGACAGGPRGGGGFREGRGPGLRPIAEPGEVVAAELGFASAAQDDGQWAAFDRYAADEAVMYAPGPVKAKQWLKGRANPKKAITWQPYEVWSSCDGTLAASKGPWQRPDGSFGYFTTIWARQKDGSYKWVLDMGDKLTTPLSQPEFVQADVADCPARGARARQEGRPEGKRGAMPQATIAGTLEDRSGKAADGTLAFSSAYAPDGTLTLTVSLAKGGAMKEVVHDQVAP